MAASIRPRYLRKNLARVLDRVVDEQETIVVRRAGSRDVAFIDASELSSLQETLYLLSSPANASRLLTAIERSRANTFVK